MTSSSPRKRSNENTESMEEDEPVDKCSKTFVSEFRLKLQGSDPIEALKQLLKDEREDIIEEYIRQGGSLSELLAILNNFDVKKNIPQAIPVFQAITIFIIKSMSSFGEKHKELVDECRQLLSIHLSLFHSMLTAVYSPRQKKVALKLLTALVSCDQELAWKILTSLKLTHQDIEALAFARKQTDPTSVREHFIRFLMAFLIDQPVELIRKFLAQRGLLVSIFSGLKADNYQDIIMVLTTLKTTIVDDKNINKTQKLSIFNTASLCHLVGVYFWDPRSSENQLENKEGSDEVRHCLHELLLVLLTSVKMGVVFNDPSIGTSHREFNELVATVINGFGKPWGDELREDLFVKMLSACPDVVKPAFRQIDSSLSNVDSPKWIEGLHFITKLIGHLDINLSRLPVKARTNLVKTVFVPPFLMAKLVLSLHSTHAATRYAALCCLSACLKRLESHKYQYTQSVINNYLLSNISCAESLVENIESLCSEKQIDDENSIKGLLSALDCLLFSYRICPQLLDTIRYKSKYYETLHDCLKKVKTKLKSESGDEGENEKMSMDTDPPELHSDVETKLTSLKLIELLLIIWPLDSSQESFEFWLDDLSDCISPHSDIVNESLLLIKQILGSTGYFTSHFQRELDVWMYCLSKHLSVDAVKLIVRSVKFASTKTKDVYSDLLTAEKMMTVEEQTSPLTLNLDDYINAARDCDDTVTPSDENVFSLSVPLLSMLKILHEEQTFENSQSFVVSLTVHLLHLQANSEMFVALLKLYSNSFASCVLDYAESWAKCSGSPLLLLPAFSKNSVFYITSCYLLGQSSELPDISGLNKYELELMMYQILYCSVRGCQIKATVDMLRLILEKSSKFVSTALAYQPLVDSFQPRQDLNSTSNTTHVVMALIEFSRGSQLSLIPYQHRLSLELHYALSKKSALKNCHAEIGKILEVVKVTENDAKHLLKKCCPLPQVVAQKCLEWRAIQEYLLREGIRHDVKLKLEPLKNFLNEILSSLPSYSSQEDLMFLDTVGSYLEHHYSTAKWDDQTTETLSGLLKAILKSDVWSEKLAIFLYKQAPVDLNLIPLNRLAVLIELVVVKLSPDQISELLSNLRSDIEDVLTGSQSYNWIDRFSSAILQINFGEADKNLKSICKGIMKKRKDINISVTNIKLLHSLFSKANESADLFSIVQDYLLQNYSLEDHLLGESLVKILNDLIHNFNCYLSSGLVKTLLAAGLKIPFPELLELLETAVAEDRTEPSCKEIFGLLTSHSQFLNTVISKQTNPKYEVLVLLKTLLKKDSSLIKSSHLAVYFSAYNATLSLPDQVLLQIIKMYESSGIDLSKFKPYVWGETAAQRYSVSQTRKRVDEDESSCPTIQLLDLDIVHSTIKYFPSERTVDVCEVVEVAKGSEIYDVEFLLAALSQSVGPNSPMYPSQIPCTGVTSVAFLSLGSKCPVIRAAGYHILHRHYTSLTRRKDDQLWSHLVEKLQRSVCGTENARLSGVLSVFLARSTLVMAEPFHPLFKPIHNFMLVKSVFDLNAIPAFLEFFHSSDTVNGRSLQTWILEVIRDGTRNQDDFQIVLSTLTFKLLLDFYCSKLSSSKTKLLIDEILERCIACDKKRQLLVQEYSLVPWLVFLKRYKQALDIVPNTHRYTPLKNYIKHQLEVSAVEEAEEKSMDAL